MFVVGNKSFRVECASFRVYVVPRHGSWSARYDIDISGCREHPSDTDRARLRTHDLRLDLPGPHDLPGLSVGPLDHTEGEEPAFLLTRYEHDALASVCFSFGERVGSDFRFALSATAPRWDDDESQGRPDDENQESVRIELLLPFEGVYVDEHSPAKARTRLDEAFGERRWSDPIHAGTMSVFRPVP